MRIAHPPSIAANMDMFYIESDILAPTINSTTNRSLGREQHQNL